jgi:uncharacterized protein (TIGR03067 family)
MTTRHRSVRSVAFFALLLLVSILVLVWFSRTLRDRAVKGPPASTLHAQSMIVPLDESSRAFLVDRDTKWVYIDNRTADELASTLSDCMKVVGLVPSIQTLTNLISSRKPSVSLSRAAMSHSIMIDTVHGIFGDQGSLQVSPDGHLALQWYDKNTVLVFMDGANRIEGFRYDRIVDKDDAAKEALVELQGEWIMVSGSFGGLPATSVRQVYKESEVTTKCAEHPDLVEKIVVDPTKPAKTIDFESTDESGVIRKRLGIYSLGGDQLLLEMAEPGGERPVHFFSGGHMSEWKREGPRESKP